MNFNDLMAKMRELDQPATETIQPSIEAPVEECGEMPPAPMGMEHKDTPPPSMSINLNAQGLDDIAELMKIMTKVNPDMINQKDGEEPGLPKLGMEPSITSIKPSLPPLKMLPEPIDRDGKEDGEADNDDDEGVLGTMAGAGVGAALGGPLGAAVGGAAGNAIGDLGDEPEEKEDEAYGNSLNGSEPETKDVSAAIPDGNDLNKPKTMVKHSYRQGDNPMAMDENELRAAIRAELMQRLAEAKSNIAERDEGKPGKNFAKIAKSAGKHYGSKEAGERVAGAVRAKLAKAGKL